MIIRILHIIDHFGLGGAQTILEGLSKSKENTIYFYALRKDRSECLSLFQNGYCVNSKSKYSFPIFEIKKFIYREKIDVLHLHLLKSTCLGILLKCLFFRNIKIIIHEHGEIYFNGFRYTHFLNRLQYKTNLFISISKAIKSKLIQNAGIREDKIKILYNYVDLDQFSTITNKFDRERERRKLGIKNDEFVVGFAGRLVEIKGWRIYLKAFSILSKYIKTKAIIVGDGKDREKMLELIRNLKIKDNVIYLGFVPDIRSFYVLLDCFVIPSYWEPMGITELEAQAMGIPVVASNVDALNEIIEDKKNGLLFESKNENDLSEKIKQIHDDEKMKEKLIKNGIINAKKYSLSSYLKSINEVYKDV